MADCRIKQVEGASGFIYARIDRETGEYPKSLCKSTGIEKSKSLRCLCDTLATHIREFVECFARGFRQAHRLVEPFNFSVNLRSNQPQARRVVFTDNTIADYLFRSIEFSH